MHGLRRATPLYESRLSGWAAALYSQSVNVTSQGSIGALALQLDFGDSASSRDRRPRDESSVAIRVRAIKPSVLVAPYSYEQPASREFKSLMDCDVRCTCWFNQAESLNHLIPGLYHYGAEHLSDAAYV